MLPQVEGGLALGALPHDADLDFARSLGLGGHAEDSGRCRDLSTEPLLATRAGELRFRYADVLHCSYRARW